MPNDKVAAGGWVDIEVIRDGPSGPRVIEKRRTHNLIVNAGKKQTWRMTMALNTNAWDQMRIGTSGATTNSGQTNVLSPVTGTIDTVTTKTLSVGRTAQLVISYKSGAGTKSATGIKEVVVLNQNTSPGGSCFMRATFTAVNKTTADKLKITYNFRIT